VGFEAATATQATR